jgi:hypothetical protein
VVDKAEGGEVLGWHVEDGKGNRSINLGGPGVANVDLVLGQGRVAGQAILKDVGRGLLDRTYQAAARASGAEVKPVSTAPTASHAASATVVAGLSPGMLAALVVLLLGFAAVGYEIGRRRSA